jgi:hypothetical protein
MYDIALSAVLADHGATSFAHYNRFSPFFFDSAARDLLFFPEQQLSSRSLAGNKIYLLRALRRHTWSAFPAKQGFIR